ncbi:Laminin subunit alpha-2 [Bienertia sinuspersici]
MSSKSHKKEPISSNCSGVQQSRSISDIINSLKTSFLPSDFEDAVRELESRENGLRREKMVNVASLRDKCDVLEGELGDLKLEKCMWEEDCRRLKRQCDVNDDKLKELTRELSLMKEKEENASKRYDRLHEEVREMEEEKERVLKMSFDLRDKVEELKRKLREKEEALEENVSKVAQFNARLEELEEVKRKNVCLEGEKLKYDAHLEELKREKDERIKELLSKNEAEKSRIEGQLKAREDELQDARRKNALLEEQMIKLEAQVGELRRSIGEKDDEIKKLFEDFSYVERVKNETMKEKDGKIEELLNEKESLDLEKNRLTAKLEQVGEKVEKLEKDVITFIDFGKDKEFASSYVGKIFSGIIKAIDCEEIGLTNNAEVEKEGNAQEEDSAFVSHVIEPKSCLKFDKQSLDAVEVLEDESCRKDGATDNKKAASLDIINIDSDDENDNALHVGGVDNKRKWHGGDDGSNNSYQKQKMKKSEYTPWKQVKQEPSLSAFSGAKSYHKFNTPQRRTLETINKCNAKLLREISESRSGHSENNGRKVDDSKYDERIPKCLSPEAVALMNTCRQKMQNKILECRADMVCALAQDNDLCAKAVCALYRQQKSLSSGMSGSNLEGSKGLEECDSKRVAALAEFLIDGDRRGKMKKSVAELEQHDPKGLNDCRELAKKYSAKLIDIYVKRKDPLFSPLSSDLQYK